MLEYDEKRAFPRMQLDCPANFSVADRPEVFGAVVKNLSGGGVLLWIEGQVADEEILNIELVPPKSLTPPMRARMRVVRCTPIRDLDGQFAVACVMEQLLD